MRPALSARDLGMLILLRVTWDFFDDNLFRHSGTGADLNDTGIPASHLPGIVIAYPEW